MGEKRKNHPGLLERAADAFDLPADVLAGLPRLELIGNKELRMENHKGILSYAECEIHVDTGGHSVKIGGQGLELRVMNALELLITGRIESVNIL